MKTWTSNTKVTKKVATALKLDPEDLVTNQNNKESKWNLGLKSKAADLDYLVKEMKKKLQTVTCCQKVQTLTIIPKPWSLGHAANVFNVLRGLKQKAMILKKVSLPLLKIDKLVKSKTLCSSFTPMTIT